MIEDTELKSADLEGDVKLVLTKFAISADAMRYDRQRRAHSGARPHRGQGPRARAAGPRHALRSARATAYGTIRRVHAAEAIRTKATAPAPAPTPPPERKSHEQARHPERRRCGDRPGGFAAGLPSSRNDVDIGERAGEVIGKIAQVTEDFSLTDLPGNLQIEADEMLFDYARGELRYSGNVKVVHGDVRMRADRMILNFNPGRAKSLKQIEAIGQSRSAARRRARRRRACDL